MSDDWDDDDEWNPHADSPGSAVAWICLHICVIAIALLIFL